MFTSGIEAASERGRERSTVAQHDDGKGDRHANEQLDDDCNRQRAHLRECVREREQTRAQSAVEKDYCGTGPVNAVVPRCGWSG